MRDVLPKLQMWNIEEKRSKCIVKTSKWVPWEIKIEWNPRRSVWMKILSESHGISKQGILVDGVAICTVYKVNHPNIAKTIWFRLKTLLQVQLKTAFHFYKLPLCKVCLVWKSNGVMCQIIENNNKLNLLPLIVDIRWYTIKKISF